eukprot:1159562-Pelagomonas_calceolata.AAC.1
MVSLVCPVCFVAAGACMCKHGFVHVYLCHQESFAGGVPVWPAPGEQMLRNPGYVERDLTWRKASLEYMPASSMHRHACMGVAAVCAVIAH